MYRCSNAAHNSLINKQYQRLGFNVFTLSLRLELCAVTVAIGTFCRRGPVKPHILASYGPRQHVAPGTGDILMRTLQREGRARIVVKI